MPNFMDINHYVQTSEWGYTQTTWQSQTPIFLVS